MKSGKTWLHAAIRAHEVRTLDNQHRAREAWEALLDATADERRVAGQPGELAAAWVTQRDVGGLGPALETLYRDFHGHLHRQADLAAQKRIGCNDHWETTKAELRRTHSTQRLLERTDQKVKEGKRRELSAREAQASAEAWLFGRLARDSVEPLSSSGGDILSHDGGPDAAGSSIHASGGAIDPCVR